MRELSVEVDIARPPETVRAWWLDLPEVYEAEDPREQPHRIVKVEETADRIDLLTYWKGPFGKELELGETVHMDREDGWRIEVDLPFGLDQEDIFSLEPTEIGTRLTIDVRMWAQRWYGKLVLPFFWMFGKRSYPETWRTAARLCEQATEAPA